jgi:cytochrome c biogenesis protein CcmG, thiol:disulfide interchange protein DsbE
MASTPAAEFAQLDAIRVVSPALISLIVAPLALLARKRHRDSNFSARHLSVDEGLQGWDGLPQEKYRAAAGAVGIRITHVTTDQAGISGRSVLRRLPRLGLIVLAALLIALLAYGLAIKNPDDSIDDRLSEGRSAAAPGFSLEVLERGVLPERLRGVDARLADGKLSLDELRGTPAALNLWASWCSPCRDEAPVLEQGWRRWGRRGVLFVGLDMQDLTGDARGFLRELEVTYPSLREPGREVAKDYGATGIPETYFLSARGRVVAHVVGVISERLLDDAAAAARAGVPLGRTRAGAQRPPR